MVDKISRARKKELEQPDPFMETMQAGIDFCAKHKKQVIWALSTVLIIIVIIAGTIYSIRSSERHASALLAETLKIYNTKDAVKGYDAVQSNFNKIIEKYSNTAAGRLAGVDFAAIAYKAGKFKQAHALYLTALDNFSDDHPAIRNLLLDALGHTCQAEKKYDEAKKYFNRITESNLPFLKAEALFNLGMIDCASGHKKDGMKLFKEIVSQYGDSIYKQLAQNKIENNG